MRNDKAGNIRRQYYSRCTFVHVGINAGEKVTSGCNSETRAAGKCEEAKRWERGEGERQRRVWGVGETGEEFGEEKKRQIPRESETEGKRVCM